MTCVNEVKKNIQMRKKVRKCTFEDFTKEDKLTLLIKIVSNQEILAYLYEKIFKEKSSKR